jgi:hypothetical protein
LNGPLNAKPVNQVENARSIVGKRSFI